MECGEGGDMYDGLALETHHHHHHVLAFPRYRVNPDGSLECIGLSPSNFVSFAYNCAVSLRVIIPGDTASPELWKDILGLTTRLNTLHLELGFAVEYLRETFCTSPFDPRVDTASAHFPYLSGLIDMLASLSSCADAGLDCKLLTNTFPVSVDHHDTLATVIDFPLLYNFYYDHRLIFMSSMANMTIGMSPALRRQVESGEVILELGTHAAVLVSWNLYSALHPQPIITAVDKLKFALCPGETTSIAMPRVQSWSGKPPTTVSVYMFMNGSEWAFQDVSVTDPTTGGEATLSKACGSYHRFVFCDIDCIFSMEIKLTWLPWLDPEPVTLTCIVIWK